MAEAKGHKFGQTLGVFCEKAIEPALRRFAKKHGLYLDTGGTRPARKGKKLKWLDEFGNTHDLDFVLERDGTPQKFGTPVAFIESAWRRYTKHSRNKAQEIQGAVLPVRQKHRYSAPFVGCFLVGVYTEGAIAQLESLGFQVLYFEYETIVAAFQTVGMDSSFEEATSDDEIAKKQERFDKLQDADKKKVARKLLRLNKPEFDNFMETLEETVLRQISQIRIIPLHGQAVFLGTVKKAIRFVEEYDENHASVDTVPLAKYEVQIRYDNGDKIDGEFQNRSTAIEFLQCYQTGNWQPAIDDNDLSDVIDGIKK